MPALKGVPPGILEERGAKTAKSIGFALNLALFARLYFPDLRHGAATFTAFREEQRRSLLAAAGNYRMVEKSTGCAVIRE